MAIYETSELYTFDRAIARTQTGAIVGIDEAGRGPLAGPVVAAAVTLNLTDPIEGVMDSKKIAPKKRAKLFKLITQNSIAWAYAVASVHEIDTHNILNAALMAMKRSLEKIASPWSLALIDGNKAIPGLDTHRQMTVIRGDSKSASIAAASIIAKVIRDSIMEEYHKQYPQYEFHRHKGYPTLYHRNRIKQLGICDIHRKTFCTRLTEKAVV